MELDGSQHLDSSRDLRRDAFMNEEDWSSLAFGMSMSLSRYRNRP
ncbi:hypothetical protein [Rhizobium sp. BR 317]